MFIALACVVVVMPQIFVGSFCWLAKKRRWLYIGIDSRQMYVDLAKSLLTSAGIASSIMVGTYSHSQMPAWMVGHGLMFLVACIVSSVWFMTAISRFYETATSREPGKQPAPLMWWELLVVLILADMALSLFLIGFLYIGRIGYVLSSVR